ncbi:MAG: hypothetical protein BAJATHORv1_30490 [Candidatus Thorarchaeota archaeon]|nr:MAG: hypothetical protein BAJATHORv1_30490 [Candidatus Thorarchaeota archaeon]
MLIVGICGSPKRKNSSTRFLLQKALEAASEALSDGETKGETLLLDISEYEIRQCTGCDACVRKTPCPESDKDDMPKIEEQIKQADAIIIAAPSYFTSVPGVLKDFMDRSRPMKMLNHELRDKIFGAITYAGLRYGGQEPVIELLHRFALAHGMIIAGGVGSPVKDGPFGSGAMQKDEGGWRIAKEDELAIAASEGLGKRIAKLVKRFNQ